MGGGGQTKSRKVKTNIYKNKIPNKQGVKKNRRKKSFRAFANNILFY